jgi:O-antigen ligase
MVFSLPFVATAVVNIGSKGSASGLQAAILFGTLWLVRSGPKTLGTPGLWESQHIRTSIRHLRFFMLVVAASLVMPIWIHGGLTVDCADPMCTESAPLNFSLRNITQALYLAYGVIITVFVAIRNSDIREFRKSTRIFLASAIFVSFWGLLQWYCYQVGISYPAFVFNTSATKSAGGYTQVLGELGLTRISSVETEPSMFAQFILIALVFAMFAAGAQREIISKFWDRVALVAMLMALLLSTSTTAYVGLAILVPVFLVGLWFLRRLDSRVLVAIGFAVFVAFAVYAHSLLTQNLIDRVVFSKMGRGSGNERLNYVLRAFTYFRRYPLLGIGWGSARSDDLFVKLLANAGILGLVAFVLFLKTLFSGLWKSMVRPTTRQRMSERTYWACCFWVASFILIVMNALTGFAFVYGHLWFILGMAIATPIYRDSRPFAQSRMAPMIRVESPEGGV